MAAAKTPAQPNSDAAKPYVVFARRFRPQTFSDVAGQSAVTGALRQALMSGRLAQAYMLCGPRGVGKTSLARIFAKACNCLNGTGPNGAAEEPCNTCSACVSIQDGSSLDVIEMDAATNRGIEEVRSLRENVGIAPAQLRYKVYIIDEVHMLTREAWNAFLKTLEEPPAHVKFIFATTDPNDVPETILSRCQRFDLRRIGLSDIIKRLRKICDTDGVKYEEAALSRIASLAKGGLRDAEGMLDQAVNLGNGTISDAVIRELSGAAPDELLFEILKSCAAGRTADVLAKAHAALEAGADPDDMLAVLCDRLRSAVLTKVCGADSPLLEGQTHLKEAYAELSAILSEDQCLMLIQLFTNARRQMRDAAQTRLPLEVALIRAARARELIDLSKLASALESNAGKSPAAMAAQGSAPNRSPEGARPNSQGRPAPDRIQPAAETGVQRQEPRTPVSGAAEAPAEKWPLVIDAIKSQKGVLAGALAHSSAAFDAEVGEVVLSSADPFYRGALINPQNLLLLKNTIAKVLGRNWTVRVSDGTNPAAAARAVASVAPLIRKPAQGLASTPALPQSGVPRTQEPRAAVINQPAQPPAEMHASEESWETLPDDIGDEYTDAGALPLDTSVPSAEAYAAPLPQEDSDRDEPPPAAVQRVVPPAVTKVRATQPQMGVDSKLVENNALVQAILKGTRGILLEVEVTRKKEAGETKKQDSTT